MRNLIHKKRKGFTLIELVVVILILGILVAIAAPKMYGTTLKAREHATRQSLTTIRNAIELYAAEFEVYPSATTIDTQLDGFLQGTGIPSPQSGTNQNNSVRSFSGTFAPSGTEGWAYNESTGEFFFNDASNPTW